MAQEAAASAATGLQCARCSGPWMGWADGFGVAGHPDAVGWPSVGAEQGGAKGVGRMVGNGQLCDGPRRSGSAALDLVARRPACFCLKCGLHAVLQEKLTKAGRGDATLIHTQTHHTCHFVAWHAEPPRPHCLVCHLLMPPAPQRTAALQWKSSCALCTLEGGLYAASRATHAVFAATGACGRWRKI
jgi:hypothetical protein